MKQELAKILSIGVIGVGAVACGEPHTIKPPDYCKDNAVGYSIPGSKFAVATAQSSMEAGGVSQVDLASTNNDNLKQRIGNLIIPDSPGITRPGTAAIYHADREIFDENYGMLGILTDNDFVLLASDRRYQGVLKAGEQEIPIVSIDTESVSDAYANTDSTVELDGSIKNKELIKVKFDLSSTTFDLASIGFEVLRLDMHVVDCQNEEAIGNTGRSFQLNPVDYPHAK